MYPFWLYQCELTFETSQQHLENHRESVNNKLGGVLNRHKNSIRNIKTPVDCGDPRLAKIRAPYNTLCICGNAGQQNSNFKMLEWRGVNNKQGAAFNRHKSSNTIKKTLESHC